MISSDLSLPKMYQNFKTNPNLGGLDVFTDHCPHYSAQTLCSDPTNQPDLDLYGEEYQSNSRCFNFANEWKTPIKELRQPRTGCYPVQCRDDGTYTVRVQKTTYTCIPGTATMCCIGCIV